MWVKGKRDLAHVVGVKKLEEVYSTMADLCVISPTSPTSCCKKLPGAHWTIVLTSLHRPCLQRPCESFGVSPHHRSKGKRWRPEVLCNKLCIVINCECILIFQENNENFKNIHPSDKLHYYSMKVGVRSPGTSFALTYIGKTRQHGYDPNPFRLSPPP